MDGLSELKLRINTPWDAGKHTGLVTFTTERHEENQRLFNTLAKEGIVVALRYAAGVGGIRVSCHFFNTEEELDALLAVMKRTLA